MLQELQQQDLIKTILQNQDVKNNDKRSRIKN